MLLLERPDRCEDLLEHCHGVRRGGSIGGHGIEVPREGPDVKTAEGCDLMRLVDGEMGPRMIVCPVSNEGGGR